MSYNHVWAEISLEKIANNIKNLKSISRSSNFMAVVKADGYGHGSVSVSKVALENGADYLGVARINEAIKLRDAGITAPILVLGYTDPIDTAKLIDYDLIQTVFSKDVARSYGDVAIEKRSELKIHIKVDTGMGRLGIVVDDTMDCIDEVKSIFSMGGLVTEGIYTHFASSDSFDKTSAMDQLIYFNRLLKKMDEEEINIPIIHTANSAAIMEIEESHFDMVRAGISMYGLYPSDEVEKRIELEPAMELKCKVAQVKTVPENFSVSYGSTYKTKSKTTLVTLPIGYADGFNRHFSSNGEMILNGKKVPIVGRVCMDQTVLNAGDIDVSVGDEVVIFGKQKDSTISIDDIAKSLNTINYEVVTTIMERVPRVYV